MAIPKSKRSSGQGNATTTFGSQHERDSLVLALSTPPFSSVMARLLCLLGLAHAAAAQGRGGGRGGGGAGTYCEDHPTECWGQPCSLSSCSCAGYCFADQKLQVFNTAPDADGYSYKFSMCGPLQDKDLPLGCKTYSEDATAVRYKVLPTPLRRWQPPLAAAPPHT